MVLHNEQFFIVAKQIDPYSLPVKRFHGLTTQEMETLTEFSLFENPIVRLNANIPKGVLDQIPIYKGCELFLRIVDAAAGGIKLSKEGHIPDEFARAFLEIIGFDQDEERTFDATEEGNPLLWKIRALIEIMAAVEVKSKKLRLSEKGRGFLLPENRNVFFQALISAYTGEYHWGTTDGYSELEVGMVGWAYAFVVIKKAGTKGISFLELSENYRAVFEPLYMAWLEEEGGTLDSFEKCLFKRLTLDFFNDFSLVDCKMDEESTSLTDKHYVIGSLADDVFTFKIPKIAPGTKFLDEEPDAKPTASKPPLSKREHENFLKDLQDLMSSKDFKSSEDMMDFLNREVTGKMIDEIIPEKKKKGKPTKADKIEDFLAEADDSEPGKAVELSKKVLELDPENVEALMIQVKVGDFKQESDRLAMLNRAIALAEKELGADFIAKNRGHFWGLIQTRTYMKALYNKAEILTMSRNLKGAETMLNEMISLNPNDNLGARFLLSTVLLKSAKLKEYLALYKQYEAGGKAGWLYNYAYFMLLSSGFSTKADAALLEAHKANRFIAPMLLGRIEPKPSTTGYITMGDETEASEYLLDNYELWLENPRAMNWLMRKFGNVKGRAN